MCVSVFACMGIVSVFNIEILVAASEDSGDRMEEETRMYLRVIA